MQIYKYTLALVVCSLMHNSYSMSYRKLQHTNTTTNAYIAECIKHRKTLLPHETKILNEILASINANKRFPNVEALNKLNNWSDIDKKLGQSIKKKQSNIPSIQKFTIIEDYQQQNIQS